MEAQERRLRLYQETKQVYSDESASELMAALPPVGWGDVATRNDLVLLRRDMDVLGAELRAEMHKGFNKTVIWSVSVMIAMTAIFATLVQLGK